MQGEKVLADMEDKGQNPLNSLVGSKVFTSYNSNNGPGTAASRVCFVFVAKAVQ